MKCLVIHGSPSKTNGQDSGLCYTPLLAAAVTGEMARLGPLEVQEIWLADVGLPYCAGCYRCFFQGEDACPHAPIVQPIMRAIARADCVIMSSPVYALNITALLKSFIDHGAYAFHRPRFFEKRGLVISAAAGAGERGAGHYMRDVLKHWGFNRVDSLCVKRGGAPGLTDKVKRQCHRQARRLYEDARSGKLHPPTLKRILFYQIWRNLARVGEGADHDYWVASALADHPFAPMVPLPGPHRLFGKALNALLGKVMK